MNDLEKIILTSALTVAGGLVVFVIGQMAQRLLIEPIQELRKAVGQIRFALLFHAPVLLTPVSRNVQRSDAAYEALMHSSCDLLMRVDAVPFYNVLAEFLQLFPSKKNVQDAAKWLRALSTYVHETGDKADEHIEQVSDLMKKVELLLEIQSLSN